ncbi:MAG: AMP-binding protein [Caulobacterales bacterium]
MDDATAAASLRMRDPLFAPRRLEIERAADGAMVLFNPAPFDERFETTLGALQHWAAAAPDRVALAERSGEGWRRVTYAEAWDQVRAMAGGLAALGLPRQSPVLILARNSIDVALFTYAAMSQALIANPVSPQYGLAGADLSRLLHAVELTRPAAVFADDAAAFPGALEAPFLAGLPVIAGRNAGDGRIGLVELLRAAPAAPVARPDDIAKLLLTSGSTGQPKAVIGLHRAAAVNAAQIAACFVDPEPPVLVHNAPWSHSLGANAILHTTLQRGGTLYVDAGAPVAGRMGEMVRTLRQIAPTYHNMVPAGWDLLAGELERDEALARRFFSRVRLLQYGGAALGQSTADRIQAVALRTVGETISFSSGYGATETGPTATNVHWPNTAMGLIGLPVPGTRVKLAPAGDKLEFRVKGPQVSPGYYRAPDATAAAFDEEGYYRLGDAARLVDPQRPELGMAFDGRLSENFKLSSGTFVTAGALRVAALSATGGAALDAVVCGEGRGSVGLLVFLSEAHCHGMTAQAIRAEIRDGLACFNAAARGAGGRIARVLILADQPHVQSGEITDKGYINQAKARERRAADVERLFASPPDSAVIILED